MIKLQVLEKAGHINADSGYFSFDLLKKAILSENNRKNEKSCL